MTIWRGISIINLVQTLSFIAHSTVEHTYFIVIILHTVIMYTHNIVVAAAVKIKQKRRWSECIAHQLFRHVHSPVMRVYINPKNLIISL